MEKIKNKILKFTRANHMLHSMLLIYQHKLIEFGQQKYKAIESFKIMNGIIKFYGIKINHENVITFIPDQKGASFIKNLVLQSCPNSIIIGSSGKHLNMYIGPCKDNTFSKVNQKTKKYTSFIPLIFNYSTGSNTLKNILHEYENEFFQTDYVEIDRNDIIKLYNETLWKLSLYSYLYNEYMYRISSYTNATNKCEEIIQESKILMNKDKVNILTNEMNMNHSMGQ